MYTIVSIDCKFKTNQENIENVLQHFGLRKIQSNLYARELDNNERETIAKNIKEIVKANDSILMIPVCQNCFSKKDYCGREMKFRDDYYRVY